MTKLKPTLESLMDSQEGQELTSPSITENLINLIEELGGVCNLDLPVAGELSSGRPVWSWVSYQGGPVHLIRLLAIQKALEELKEYKPLTIRQVFYYLVGQGEIKNERKYYDEIDDTIKYGRIRGRISWDDIEDRTRIHHNFRGWVNLKSFIKEEVDDFLARYRHDYMKDSKKYLEVWIEKDALSSIFTKFAEPYGVSVEVCRGNQSVSHLHEYDERIKRHLRAYCKRLKKHSGQQPVLLYFGDFDPCGMKMFDSMQITLIEEMEVEGIEFKRIALVEGDIKKYNLPHDFKAIKPGDTNAKWFVEKYGEHAVELDALKPKELGKIVKDAIEAEIDMKLYQKEQRAAKRIKAQLKKLKEKMLKLFLKKRKKNSGGHNTPPKKNRPKRKVVVREAKVVEDDEAIYIPDRQTNITKKDKEEIFNRIGKGETIEQVALEFGTSRQRIKQIVIEKGAAVENELSISRELVSDAQELAKADKAIVAEIIDSIKKREGGEVTSREVLRRLRKKKCERVKPENKSNALNLLLKELGLKENDVPKSLLSWTKKLFEDDPDNAMRKAKWTFNSLKIKKEPVGKNTRDKVLDYLQAQGMAGFIKGFGYSGGWRNIPDSVLFSFAEYSGKDAKDMDEAYENVKKQYDDYIGKIIKKRRGE